MKHLRRRRLVLPLLPRHPSKLPRLLALQPADTFVLNVGPARCIFGESLLGPPSRGLASRGLQHRKQRHESVVGRQRKRKERR